MSCKSCCKKNSGTDSAGQSESSLQPEEESSLLDEDEEEEYVLDSEIRRDCDRIMDFRASKMPYLWYPSLQNVKQIDYVRRLECDFESLQTAFFSLTTHFARLQFRLRQIMTAPPCERDELFRDLEQIAFGSLDDCQVSDEMPHIQHDHRAMGDVRRKQAMICEHLRSQLTALSEASEIEGMDIIDMGPYVYDEECDRRNSAAAAAAADADEAKDSDLDDKHYGRRPMGIPVSMAKNEPTAGGGGSGDDEEYATDSDERRNKQQQQYERQPNGSKDVNKPRMSDKTTVTHVSLVESTDVRGGNDERERRKQRRRRH